MSPSRRAAIALGLLAAASSLVLWAASADWLVVGTLPSGPGNRTGGQLFGMLPGVGLLGLAAVAGIIATRGIGRKIVSAIVILAGLGGAWAVSVSVASGDSSGGVEGSTLSAWWVLAVLGCLLIAGSGTWALVDGRAWPALGQRYERQVSPTGGTPWESLDHGEDPTA